MAKIVEGTGRLNSRLDAAVVIDKDVAGTGILNLRLGENVVMDRV